MFGLAAGSYAASGGAPWTEARLRIERGPEGALRGISGEVVLRSGQVVSFLGERDVSEREGRISGTVRFYSSRRLDRTGSRLTVAPAADEPLAALLTLDTGTGEASAVLPFQDACLRRLTLAMDGIAGLPVPDPAVFAGVVAALKTASIAVAVDASPVIRPNPYERTTYNPAELHGLMTAWGNPPRGGFAPWWLHVLFAGRYEGREGAEVSGVMYDVGVEADAFPRQGLAVFLESKGIAGQVPVNGSDWQREVLFTLVHEIGHGLNLPHCFESDRADSLTWMNYPDRIAGKAPAFWQVFKDSFDDTEGRFLCHAPHHDIAPGEAAYATRASTLIAGGSADGTALRTPSADAAPDAAHARLTIAPLKPGGVYGFGEPIYLALGLENTGASAIRYAKAFDLSDGLVTIAVTAPNGHVRVLRPPLAFCKNHRLRRLAPGRPKVVFDAILASFDAAGALFDVPGRYRIEARFAGVPGGTLAAATTLRVLYPTRAEELLAIRIWDDGPLMRAIYLRQPLVAHEAWTDLVEAHDHLIPSAPDITTRDVLTAISASGWLQRFAPASGARAYAPDPAKARERLERLRSAHLPLGLRRIRRRATDPAKGDKPADQA